MGAVLTETSAHVASQTWDCSTPNCPRVATKRGPGGNPYCDECKTRIYAKKVRTTEARHGTAGGGGHAKLLIDADREALTIDQLTRRIRIEAKGVERAARSRRALDLLPSRKREVVLTLRALAVKLASI